MASLFRKLGPLRSRESRSSLGLTMDYGRNGSIAGGHYRGHSTLGGERLLDIGDGSINGHPGAHNGLAINAASQVLSPTGVLKMHYGDSTVLTAYSNRYKEIEQSARRLFLISKKAIIRFEAEIASLGGERIMIDPKLWGSLDGLIAEVWVTQPIKQPKVPHHVTLWPLKRGETTNYNVVVYQGATIAEVKEQLSRINRSAQVDTIVLWEYSGNGNTCIARNSLRNEMLALASAYYFDIYEDESM